jgi:hypothetical protein
MKEIVIRNLRADIHLQELIEAARAAVAAKGFVLS